MAPGQNLARQAYLWDDARSLGKPRTDFSPVTTAFEAAVSALGVRAWLIERFTHALYLSLAALGVILLMRAFRPRVGLAHAVAAFVYTFSPFTTQFLLPSPYFLSYALAPWFAWFALRGVRDGDPWRWAAAFALAIAASWHFNAAALGFALLPAALIALYFSLYERRGFTRALEVDVAGRAAERCSPAAAGIVVLWFSDAGSERQPAHDGASGGRGADVLLVRELARPRVLAHLLLQPLWRRRSAAGAVLLHPARRDRGLLCRPGRRADRARARRDGATGCCSGRCCWSPWS